jgi:hypothetical protein
LCAQPEIGEQGRGASALLDLNATIVDIVERSFPELRNIQISCQLTDTAEDYLAGIHWKRTDPPSAVITFSATDAEQMSDPALVGCIVHELCHAEFDAALSPSVFASNDRQYAADPQFRTSLEREIDLVVIKKGYGRELLALQTYHNQHYDAYEPSDGLTPEETQALIDGADL